MKYKQKTLVALLSSLTACSVAEPRYSGFRFVDLKEETPSALPIQDPTVNTYLGNSSSNSGYVGRGSNPNYVNSFGFRDNSYDSSSVDIGPLSVSAPVDGNSFRVKTPIIPYSPTFEFSTLPEFQVDRSVNYGDRDDFYLNSDNLFMRTDDAFSDPERKRKDISYVTGALGKWALGLDIFKPVRELKDEASKVSNMTVSAVLGSRSRVDYDGRDLAITRSFSTERCDFETTVWVNGENLKDNGVMFNFVFPFGRSQQINSSYGR